MLRTWITLGIRVIHADSTARWEWMPECRGRMDAQERPLGMDARRAGGRYRHPRIKSGAGSALRDTCASLHIAGCAGNAEALNLASQPAIDQPARNRFGAREAQRAVRDFGEQLVAAKPPRVLEFVIATGRVG